MAVSEDVGRDSTEDWLLPEAARPRSFAEIESRIELAVSVAHASEAAVAEVGAAAIEAAEQARQAAELAERAAIAAQTASMQAEAASVAAPVVAAPVVPAPVVSPASAPSPQPEVAQAGPGPGPGPGPGLVATPVAGPEEEWLLRFTHRAERLSARLVRLQHR